MIIGGVGKKPELYALDAIGGMGEEDMTATGSGSPIAYGILEDYFEPGKSVKQNIPIALRALMSAIKRDIATENGINLVTITEKEYKEFKPSEINDILEKEGIKKPQLR